MMKRLASLLVTLIVLSACSLTTPATMAPSPIVESTPTVATGATGASAQPSLSPSVRTSPALASPAGSPARPPSATAPASPTRSGVQPVGTPIGTPTPRSVANATSVPNSAPEAAEALIAQAIGVLLNNYVDPLQSSTLYQTAYDGAVVTLRASGKTPQVQQLAFTNDPKSDATIFQNAYLALTANAGPEINQTLLAYESIRAVTRQLNECHTAFLDPEANRAFNAGLSGTDTYGGIGVQIRANTRPVTIGVVFPNTPAAQSGLRAGDAILAVDGIDVTALSADQISPLVRGPAGSQVTLTIQRPGEATPRQFTITRAEIRVPVFTAEVMTAPNGQKIGYMKLYSFSTGAETQVQRALDDFSRQGVTGWVFDLRDNGGGLIDTLSKITSRFVKNGQPVAYRTERDGSRAAIPTDPRLYIQQQQPLAVLINGGSASSSEAFAAAIADYDVGRLFGQKTAGCLAGATTFDLPDGSAMQVTIWKVVSPNKREINRVGQQPDTEIAADPTGATDPVLDGAIAWLATQKR